MKQGQASSSGAGSQKREPIPHKVNVAAVADMGNQVIRHTAVPMYEGRGLEAPHAGTTIHNTGSQGKHR